MGNIDTNWGQTKPLFDFTSIILSHQTISNWPMTDWNGLTDANKRSHGTPEENLHQIIHQSGVIIILITTRGKSKEEGKGKNEIRQNLSTPLIRLRYGLLLLLPLCVWQTVFSSAKSTWTRRQQEGNLKRKQTSKPDSRWTSLKAAFTRQE